jgi:short-subunit dehydrogenase
MSVHELIQHTELDVRDIFETNVYGHIWTIQEFLPKMIAQNHGHIVGISSMSGLSGMPNLSIYGASNAALRILYEALEEEIRVKLGGKSKVIKN